MSRAPRNVLDATKVVYYVPTPSLLSQECNRKVAPLFEYDRT